MTFAVAAAIATASAVLLESTDRNPVRTAAQNKGTMIGSGISGTTAPFSAGGSEFYRDRAYRRVAVPGWQGPEAVP